MVIRQVHRIQRGAQQFVNIALYTSLKYLKGQRQGADFFMHVGFTERQIGQVRAPSVELQAVGLRMQRLGGAIQVGQVAGGGEQ